MKNKVKFLIAIFVVILTLSGSLFSQETNRKKVIVIESIDKALIEEGESELRFEFYLLNMFSEESTKPYLEKASFFPEIKKLVIKNVPDQQGRRYCFATIDKNNKDITLTKLLNLLDVKEVKVAEETTDLAGFIEICK